MSTADFASASNNAVAFASIVYVLAFLAHLTEWVLVRSLPSTVAVGARQPVAVGAGAAAGGSDVAPLQPDEEDRELRVEKWGRIGVALTVVGGRVVHRDL